MTHDLYYRPPAATSKQWVPHDTFESWDTAMTASLKLNAVATWVTSVEHATTANTDLTPADRLSRPSGATAKSVVHTERLRKA
jgi:hypothetical protein